jgi:uncharacterized tellurite resistance protein B-like protein
MTKSIAGFTILNIFARMDGKFSDSEAEVVMEYIDKKYDSSFDVAKETAELLAMDREQSLQKFAEAAEFFMSDSDTYERIEMLRYILSLVKSDNKAYAGEKVLFVKLTAVWGIAPEDLE